MTCSLSQKGHSYNSAGVCACGVDCGTALADAFKRVHTTDSNFWLVRDPSYPNEHPHIVIARTQNEALVASALLLSYEGEEAADYFQDAVAVPLTEAQVETLKLKHGAES